MIDTNNVNEIKIEEIIMALSKRVKNSAVVEVEKEAVEVQQEPVETTEIAQEATVAKEVEKEAVEVPQETVDVIHKNDKPEGVQVNRQVTNVPVQAKAASMVATTATASFAEQAAEQGFEDVEIEGFGAFPIIVLGSDGKFECDEEDWGDEGFVGQLQKTKAVYLCKQKDVENGPVAYTYDKVNLNSAVEDATTVDELRQLWAEEGETLEIKKYLEVLVEIVGDHEYEGQFFIVKLPPASSQAFNGQLFIASRKYGIPLNQVKMFFGVGARRSHGKNKYYPWKFRLVTE